MALIAALTAKNNGAMPNQNMRSIMWRVFQEVFVSCGA